MSNGDSKRRRRRKPLTWMKDGQRVRYFPIAGEDRSFVGTIDGAPWQLGHGRWVVNVGDMEPAYRDGYGRVHAASIDHLEKADG